MLGLAGANSLADKDSMERQFPFGHVKIVSDAVSALQGALGQDDGAIVILGTGSVFVKGNGAPSRLSADAASC